MPVGCAGCLPSWSSEGRGRGSCALLKMSLFSPTECLGDGLMSVQCIPLSLYGLMDLTLPSSKFTYIILYMEHRFPHFFLCSNTNAVHLQYKSRGNKDFFLFIYRLPMLPQILLCNTGQPWTHDTVVSAFQVLGLQSCATMPGMRILISVRSPSKKYQIIVPIGMKVLNCLYLCLHPPPVPTSNCWYWVSPSLLVPWLCWTNFLNSQTSSPNPKLAFWLFHIFFCVLTFWMNSQRE